MLNLEEPHELHGEKGFMQLASKICDEGAVIVVVLMKN